MSFLVIRNDRIVYEWYVKGRSATDKHGTASLAKAIVGGMTLAVALHDGRVRLDEDLVSRLVPEWGTDPRKSLVTVRQLGSHTSGLGDAESNGLPHDRLPGWMGDFWKRLDPPNDPFTIARDKVPVLFEPGMRLQYSNPGIGMLSICDCGRHEGHARKRRRRPSRATDPPARSASPTRNGRSVTARHSPWTDCP